MAGTVTQTNSYPTGTVGITKYSLAWVSDASGDVNGNSVSLLPGSILAVEFIPDAGGTQPTDLYDVDLQDAENISMFDDGAGTKIGDNLSNTTASHKVPFINGATTTYVRTWLHGGTYELVVTNAGNAKGGTVNIYVSRTPV